MYFQLLGLFYTALLVLAAGLFGVSLHFASSVFQNLIFDSAHLKLELDAFIFWLPLNRIFPSGSGHYGYSGWCDNLAFLPKDKIGIATYASIFALDYICDLLKLLHMAV